MRRLELSEGDWVGAVEVCDDIAAKMAFQAPAAEQLLDVIAKPPPERASSQAVREVKGMKGMKGTSLGGERPKLTPPQQWAVAVLRAVLQAHTESVDDHTNDEQWQ